MHHITTEQRRARIGARHLLAPSRRALTVEEVVDAVVGLHATDAATVFLSACARLAVPEVAAVERAFYEDVTVVRLLSMRRTIFAVTTELAPVVNASTARAIAAKERVGVLKHLAEGGGWDARWLAKVEADTLAALEKRGEATASELAADVPALSEQIVVAAGKPYEAKQAVTSRIVRLLAAEGRIRRCRPRGGWISSQFRWALSTAMPDLPVAEAKADLARCWLAAYGPATEADLKWWTGWTLTDVRKALAAVGAEPVSLDEGQGLVLPGDTAPVEVEPWAALLPALDPTAMGWQERTWYLPDEHRTELFDRSGNIGPTVWWNGQIVGGWAQRVDGGIAWRLLADPGREAVAAIEAEVARLSGWLCLDGVRVTPRFRTPLERELAG